MVATWHVISSNLQGYITLATQGLPATMGLLSINNVRLPEHHGMAEVALFSLELNGSSDEKSPEDMRDAFGPPSYMDTLLADMGPESGRINKALSDFLAIPYVNAFKVTTKQGKETDLRSVVLDIRAKYLALQTKSLPIIMDINAYSLVSQVILPKINQPGGIPLETYLEEATMLVMVSASSCPRKPTNRPGTGGGSGGLTEIKKKPIAPRPKGKEYRREDPCSSAGVPGHHGPAPEAARAGRETD